MRSHLSRLEACRLLELLGVESEALELAEAKAKSPQLRCREPALLELIRAHAPRLHEHRRTKTAHAQRGDAEANGEQLRRTEPDLAQRPGAVTHSLEVRR